jgi:hypothetical protein
LAFKSDYFGALDAGNPTIHAKYQHSEQRIDGKRSYEQPPAPLLRFFVKLIAL